MRGRILAIDHDAHLALIRGEHGDARVPLRPGWRAGDLVDTDAGARIAYAGGDDYPGPATEVARLPRARLGYLHARAHALAAVRRYFAGHDFLEVETPLLVPSPGLELHLDAVAAGDGYLITSPEYQMKRLLAGGLERIVQICRCFRANERGAHHASEFTMIEWYRAWAGLDAVLADTEQLVSAVALAVRGAPSVVVDGRELKVGPPWPRITVRDAMATHAGVTVDGDEPADVLAARLAAAGIETGDAAAWDDLFFAGFLARVEPALARLDHAVFVTDWPAPLAALARRRPDDPRVVERFEAYIGGVELCNAFGELTDPVEQRARFESDLARRRDRGRAQYPIDERLLAALAEGLPPCAGNALGFDRLVMLATGAAHIRDVSAFSADEL
jgi:elongation factor P--(R)-beta-lysine ligase